MKNVIKEFQGDFRFLSNFYPSEIECSGSGSTFPTVEHYYQFWKAYICGDYERKCEVVKAKTPWEAKRAAKGIVLNEVWHNRDKWEVMESGLEKKFKIPELRLLLVATGDCILQEGNRWGDEFWGVNLETGQGRNVLGRLLMNLRREINDETTTEMGRG